MPDYLLSVHYVEGQPPPADAVMAQMRADVDTFDASLRSSGAWVFAGGLHTPDVATVVSNVDGTIETTDGPFPRPKNISAGSGS